MSLDGRDLEIFHKWLISSAHKCDIERDVCQSGFLRQFRATIYARNIQPSPVSDRLNSYEQRYDIRNALGRFLSEKMAVFHHN
ncbi:hypothetical protein ACTXT7_005231 [Hymenolepis weldensis]